MDFKKYYKFPLEMDNISTDKVFTKDYNMAFDFPFMNRGIEPVAKLSDEDRINIVKLLNGEDIKPKEKLNLSKKNSDIFITIEGRKYLFISVRGWGNLIGIGGHNLKIGKAVKIQDAFTDFIIEKLTNI